jgi:hypothetical protein
VADDNAVAKDEKRQGEATMPRDSDESKAEAGGSNKVSTKDGGEPIDRWRPQPDRSEAEPEAEYRDRLPDDLDVSGFVGPYLFPDNSRRRISAAIYLVFGVFSIALWAARTTNGVLVNRGFFIGGIVMIVVAAYHWQAGYPLAVRDLQALTAASREVGFPVGHASAQLSWRGLRSRPTWRILLYSAEDPPTKRGLVLVDGVDGRVVAHFVEDNPEDWSEFESD